jgi:tetratricopeptide (TPR) repeat protein
MRAALYRTVVRALAVVLIALPLAAQPASAELQSKYLTLAAGARKRVGSHSHFSLQTCGMMSLPRIALKRRPTQGDVSIIAEDFVMTNVDTDRGKPCLGRSVRGVAIYYTARQDAVGTDEFTYIVQYPASCANCTEKEITASIAIAAAREPATVSRPALQVVSREDGAEGVLRDDAEAEAAKQAILEEQESNGTKPLLMPALVPPATAENDTSCFLHGTDDYKRPQFLTQSLGACSRVIASGKASGTQLAYYYRGRAYWKYQLKDLDGALDDYNLARNLDPAHAEGYDYRADVWKAKGQIDRAIGDYDMAIRLDPKYGAAYYSRGRIFEKEGSLDKARADYNSALAVPQSDRLARWAQKQARERLRELDK